MSKVIFRYSWPYDRHWDSWIKQRPKFKKRKLLGVDTVFNTIKELERLWKPIEKKVLIEISKITKLEWEEHTIPCYVVSNGHGISDPMTIGVNERKSEKMIDTLMHELTHRIFIQKGNIEKTRQAWKWVESKYKNETRVARIHIICHSLLKHLYLELFSEEKIEEDIQRCQKKEDYKRAWDIVEANDYKEILEKFIGNYS